MRVGSGYQMLSSQKKGSVALGGLRWHREGEGAPLRTPNSSALLCLVIRERKTKYVPMCCLYFSRGRNGKSLNCVSGDSDFHPSPAFALEYPPSLSGCGDHSAEAFGHSRFLVASQPFLHSPRSPPHATLLPAFRTNCLRRSDGARKPDARGPLSSATSLGSISVGLINQASSSSLTPCRPPDKL